MSFTECFEGDNSLCSKPIIAFVHLGNNPASTLNWYSSEVDKNIIDKHLCLITDNPENFLDFPGEILVYDRSETDIGLKRFSKTNSSFKKISGGYWTFTTERLFALRELSSRFSERHPVIHLESDVLLLAKDEQLKKIFSQISKTSVVRYSESDGIASILIAPTLTELIQSLNNLGAILQKNRHVFSDMELLGIALNQGILRELPNSPSTAWVMESEKLYSIFFDGAFFGQYLFGLDPVHTQNNSLNGYKNPKCSYPLIESKWDLFEPSEHEGLSLGVLDVNYPSFPLCLHVHSKMLINYPTVQNIFWRKLVSDINSQNFTLRAITESTPIHSNKIKIRYRASIFLYKKIRNLNKRLFD